MNASQVRRMIRNEPSPYVLEQGWAWLRRYSEDPTIPEFPDDYGQHRHNFVPLPLLDTHMRCTGCRLVLPVQPSLENAA
jgi:hypothetical protein